MTCLDQKRWKLKLPPHRTPGPSYSKVDSAIGFPNTYPLDSDLSGG